MGKKSKHPVYDDPTAFKKQFPRIEEIRDNSMVSAMEALRPVRYFKMGKCKVTLAEANNEGGWFMSVQRDDRYPTWDEMVWLRYNLIPDACRMANILPNLNSYINREDIQHKFVFTMEQVAWVFDPMPSCTACEKVMDMKPETQTASSAVFACDCGQTIEVDFNTWNETHGNGALA